MQNIMQNPDFAKMAEDLGKKMFENDPQLASMVQVCSNLSHMPQLLHTSCTHVHDTCVSPQ